MSGREGALEHVFTPLRIGGVEVPNRVFVAAHSTNFSERLASDRLYITKSWRATGGVRAVINEHIVLKAEYLHNGEYGQVPEIANDVFTSSLVLIY